MLRIKNISLDVASEIGVPSIIAYLPTHFRRETTSILTRGRRPKQRAVPLSSLDSFHQSLLLLLPCQMLKANATQVHKAIDKPQSEI
jgi:hypothetical protein